MSTTEIQKKNTLAAKLTEFWLLAYFQILLSCAKFQQDWTTLILEIPLMDFW